MWKDKSGKLYRKYEFKTFVEAFSFITAVALLVEKADHHPTWTNTYNKVEILLSTHDEGDVITEKDTKLSKQIDELKFYV